VKRPGVMVTHKGDKGVGILGRSIRDTVRTGLTLRREILSSGGSEKEGNGLVFIGTGVRGGRRGEIEKKRKGKERRKVTPAEIQYFHDYEKLG